MSEGAPSAATPDCSLLDACPQDGLAPDACRDDLAWFTVEWFDDRIASIELDPEAAPSIPPGAWFTVFPDPAGGCALTLFSFRGAE